MLRNKKLLCFGFLIFILGTANAVPLKVLIINQSGAFLRTAPINWLSNYLLTVVGPEQGWEMVAPSTTALTQSRFRDDSLSTYQVIVFNQNTSIGNVITDANQRLAFQKWLRHGGGAVGWNGLLDHADLWPFMTDSVFSSTKFTDRSPWNSTAGKTAKVQWDTIHTNGEATVRANKPEYAALKIPFQAGPVILPDAWYSYRTNPRLATASNGWGGYPRAVDVLLTIDESTYDVPTAVRMGVDHPVAWAYTLPPDIGGKKGRFIFFGRGHDVGAFDGKSAGAAPGGIDTPSTGPTKNWILQSIRWAAGLTQSTTVIQAEGKFSNEGFLSTRVENGILKIAFINPGSHVLELFTLSGQRVARQSGEGNREYSFSNLKRSGIYWVRVRSGGQTYSSRIVL